MQRSKRAVAVIVAFLLVAWFIVPQVAAMTSPPGGAVPNSFSWDGRYGGTNYVPPIRSQGSCADCWAFAAVGDMEIQYQINRGSPNSGIDLSEQNLLDCTTGTCTVGYIDQTLNYLRDYGTPDEACDPYTGTKAVCGTGRCSDYLSRTYYITSWSQLAAWDTATIKNALYTHGPVITWMPLFSDFYTLWPSWGTTIYSHAWSTPPEGHYVVIIGWNDQGAGTTDDYWIVRNSWGTTGGVGGTGYFYMTQDPATGFFGYYHVAITIQDVTRPISVTRISTNTGQSYFPSVAASGNYVYVAWEDDTPVTGSGTAHEIWMRTSNNNGASFGSAKRISTNTGDSEFASVAADGSYVYIAWDDNTPVTGSGGKAEIWMRVSSNYGVSFGQPIRISNNLYDSLYPSVAASGSHVYVAWYDDTPVTGSGSEPEIWMRVSNNYGTSFGSAIRISMNEGASASPSVAAAGSYVYVAWNDDTPVTGSGSGFEIWMRASNNYGASFGSAIRISKNTGWSTFPSIAAIGSYVYVAWQDDTLVTGSGGLDEIWMRVSSNNAASFGSPIRISTNAYMSAGASVAAVGDSVHVAWEDDTPVTGSGTQPEIWRRTSSNNGVSFGSAIRVSTNTGESSDPSAAASGSYLYVAWSDNTVVSGSGGSSEIWMKKF